jgi:hypothetical protein
MIAGCTKFVFFPIFNLPVFYEWYRSQAPQIYLQNNCPHVPAVSMAHQVTYINVCVDKNSLLVHLTLSEQHRSPILLYSNTKHVVYGLSNRLYLLSNMFGRTTNIETGEVLCTHKFFVSTRQQVN